MPMTCATHTSQRHETYIIDKITGAANAPYMLECIDASLHFLGREYFADMPCHALEVLRREAPRAPHAQQVSIFFLLLNVDRELKQKLMGLDLDHNKLTRFFIDLRHELVPGFFCSSQSVQCFAGKCREGYLIS